MNEERGEEKKQQRLEWKAGGESEEHRRRRIARNASFGRYGAEGIIQTAPSLSSLLHLSGR